MVKLVGGIILFLVIILILVGSIPLNLWSFAVIVLALFALWFG